MNKKKLEEFQELLQEQMDQLLLDAGKTVQSAQQPEVAFLLFR